jgi:hypothetical protein
MWHQGIAKGKRHNIRDRVVYRLLNILKNQLLISKDHIPQVQVLNPASLVRYVGR